MKLPWTDSLPPSNIYFLAFQSSGGIVFLRERVKSDNLWMSPLSGTLWGCCHARALLCFSAVWFLFQCNVVCDQQTYQCPDPCNTQQEMCWIKRTVLRAVLIRSAFSPACILGGKTHHTETFILRQVCVTVILKFRFTKVGKFTYYHLVCFRKSCVFFPPLIYLFACRDFHHLLFFFFIYNNLIMFVSWFNIRMLLKTTYAWCTVLHPTDLGALYMTGRLHNCI